MPKMFGFSRRRIKLGRLKLHLGDHLHGTRSPMRQAKPLNESNEDNEVLESASGRSNDHSCQCSSGAFDLSKWSLQSSEEWTPLSTEGSKPAPRFNHAAAIVGSKMVVVGGDSGNQLLNDTMILNLDRLTWATAASRVYFVPNGTALKIPACKGHSLVPWGKTLFLVGGKTEPVTDRLSVWGFDVETEFWSQIESKGDIPVARSGHSVTRAGAVLILFGGEDAKGRKLNDLHMLDLKSLTWLPLQYKGTKPSPRSNHVATLYDDRLLFVFGGQSKSRILNDLYSLDFERMVWSRVKDQGHRPSPRAGCRGALCGNKWYITGGGSKTKRHAETLIFDILNLKWTVFVSSPITSVTTNRGFSMLPVHQKDKMFLLAFGGYKREPSNQVEVLFCTKNERSTSWRSAPDTDLLPYEDYALSTKELSSQLKSVASPTSTDPVSMHSLAAVIQQQPSGRKSISDDPNSTSNIPLPKQSHHEIDHSLAAKMQKTIKDENRKDGDDALIPNISSLQTNDMGSKRQEGPLRMDIAGILATTEEIPLESQGSDALQKEANDHNLDSDLLLQVEADGRTVHATPNAYQLYETRISSLIRKIVSLEEQLKNASTSKEAAEKNLSSAIRSRQDTDKRLADAVKEVELLKEKLAGMELAQEEANTLSNIAHSNNVRLEHHVAFLKAILDDTQKELHSTHGVLAAERARAFQLQVELFQLKQRLQPVDNRARSPRKPFHM